MELKNPEGQQRKTGSPLVGQRKTPTLKNGSYLKLISLVHNLEKVGNKEDLENQEACIWRH